MIFMLIIFVIVVLALCLSLGLISDNASVDSMSPLNLGMFQQPRGGYSDKLVNHWVDKTWRSDNRKIPCLLEEGYERDVPTKERTLIIYSHGNAEDLLLCSQFIRTLSTEMKCDTLCWDYSGYGLNSTDPFERSADGINLSLQTVVKSMLEKGYQMSNLIMWGYSLGTGPSIHNVARMCDEGKPPRALILFGAYSSILDVVKDISMKYVSRDLTSMFTERWDSKENITRVKCPVLLLHGQSDGLINMKHSKKLYEKCKKNNKNNSIIIMPNIGHTQFQWDETINHIRTWVEKMESDEINGL